MINKYSIYRMEKHYNKIYVIPDPKSRMFEELNLFSYPSQLWYSTENNAKIITNIFTETKI